MTITPALTQTPPPGGRLCRVQGDTLEIVLECDTPVPATAWLRTNIGHASRARSELIAHVEQGSPLLGGDWFDIPMQREADGAYSLVLGLSEVGHFQAKCFLLPEGTADPLWPNGENLVVNVEPADTCCGNTLYNAFVRLFGPEKSGRGQIERLHAGAIEDLDRAGYTIIPPSGTFRGLMAELDFITAELGCRIIQLLPIHPTPTTYARMGRFGSPYAALSFTSVDPALAEFDPKKTPLDQFLELVDAVHARNAKLFLDIAINHTGWAAALHATHPHWLARNPKGEIDVPGAWGVTWADLTRLDYQHKDLWQYMAEVFITWCRRGVDGFRCDAGYMIPVPTWQYIIARVRSQFPDTIFLLEGLGGKISVTRDLLGRANFNWAYSELFQNYDRRQVQTYLTEAMAISQSDGLTFHFAETHDNKRLAATSPVYARMRTALCALLSFQGAFGFANGLEWLATEKINVHQATSLNWGAGDNQVALVRRLNTLLKTHPCFFHGSRLEWVDARAGSVIALTRHHPATGKTLLILVNLDHTQATRASWPDSHGGKDTAWYDLLSDREITLLHTAAGSAVDLAPGEALCLTQDPGDAQRVQKDSPASFQPPDQILGQRCRAKVLEVLQVMQGSVDCRAVDLDRERAALQADPVAFCRSWNGHADAANVITWQWPHDQRREVMLPPGHFLLVRSRLPFHCRLAGPDTVVARAEKSLEDARGDFFALLAPLDPPAVHCYYHLSLALFGKEGCEHTEARVLCLSQAGSARVTTGFPRLTAGRERMCVLGTNGLGAMMRAHVDWVRLDSRYDGLLAANLSPLQPEDRWMMLARFRAWAVYQGYSQAIGLETLEHFSIDYDSAGSWRHVIPTGQGRHIALSLRLEMVHEKNMIRLVLYRSPAGGLEGRLPDEMPVTLILRPDIEDRNFHDTTKAYTGPETSWKACVTVLENGFSFRPHKDRHLHLALSDGQFVDQPEWQYMVHRELDARRGLDPDSDLFSPGYFTTRLRGGESRVVVAEIPFPGERVTPAVLAGSAEGGAASGEPQSMAVPEAMALALDQYLVKRGALRTVVAGYPWFLDWGRDTLIAARALVAVGNTDAAASIVRQFAGFEKDGTIPNMLNGADAGNRDTSDAPLWLFTVCSDLARTDGESERIVEMDCAGRPLGAILVAMAQRMIDGTPNGIRMDPESGLLYSPAHFTWMDTNYPACTPRQGYPIEIQALWYAALALLQRIDPAQRAGQWQRLATQVQQSILERYYREDRGYLADCLHAAPGVSAREAAPDDALRPNQLLAITLGAFTDMKRARRMLAACETLLVPGAIRSLADQPVHPPLAFFQEGRTVMTQETPYRGQYQGDEDTSRKPAYHNGTAWTWLFPSFSEAWYRVYGKASKATALAWLGSSTRLINTGCVGHVPEIVDGDAPHHQRGCDAQAWGVSELLRVWLLIDA